MLFTYFTSDKTWTQIFQFCFSKGRLINWLDGVKIFGRNFYLCSTQRAIWMRVLKRATPAVTSVLKVFFSMERVQINNSIYCYQSHFLDPSLLFVPRVMRQNAMRDKNNYAMFANTQVQRKFLNSKWRKIILAYLHIYYNIKEFSYRVIIATQKIYSRSLI